MGFNAAVLRYATAASVCVVIAVLPWVHGLESSWGYRGFKVKCEKGIRIGGTGAPDRFPGTVSSKSKCLRSCFARPECESISFSPATGRCYMSETTKDVTGVVQHEGFIYCGPEQDEVWDRTAITVALPTTMGPTTLEPNECDSGPCLNGATCNDLRDMFTCDCVPGYEGTTCNIDTDECSSNPCQNGANCVDDVNRYQCTCPAGYEGLQCETNINECSSAPCQNGGTCVDGPNEYTCTCVAGYNGVICDVDTNECASSPCQNGVCNDAVNGYTCVCSAGYEGTLCETNINECASSPCQYGACNDGVNGYTCACSAGYEGTLCETNTDECASNPCPNGVCNDGLNSFTCSCNPGYEGTLCETNIDECSSNPCVYGNCLDQVNQFTCSCISGARGELCEIEPIRLVNGPWPYEGRVEVFHGSWGTVCDDTWDMADGNVVCHQLGYPYATNVYSSATHGQGAGPIHLDNTNCAGTESSLGSCPHNGWEVHNCNHGEDSSLKCFQSSTIKLVSGPLPNEGRVEVLHNGVWGTVCDDGWGLSDGQVACRQLGYPSAAQVWSAATHGQGTGAIHLDNLACSGSETSLGACSHAGWGSHNCNHGEDASVRCNVT